MTATPSSSPSLNEASNTHMPLEKVAVLDCGAQYAKVIDRRVRELQIETEIFAPDVAVDTIKDQGIGAIIISGGPHSVYDPGVPQINPEILKMGLPVLGICYGMQSIVHHMGGTVEGGHTREYGETEMDILSPCDLFDAMDPVQHVLMSHGDCVTQMAPGFHVVAQSRAEGGRPPGIAAIAHESLPIYGLQYHPEVELTHHGKTMMANFLYKVCGFKGNFTLDHRLEHTLEEIRSTVQDNLVFVLVSGGVDSAVTAALLLKALNREQVYGIHVDSGMMRQGESDAVMEALQEMGFTHLKCLRAEEDFLNGMTEINGQPVGPLKALTDPEQKRQIIGDVFFHLVNAEMQAILDLSAHQGKTVFLAQGTLRPDLIESGNRDISASAHTIKTHHNDVDLIRQHREKGLVIETNRDWHKDEVRQIGRMLGLPEHIVQRQPFPGPGLGIRVLCTNQAYDLEHYEEVNTGLQQFIAERAPALGLQNAHGVLAPVQSVGVQGDGRTYSYLALMTAHHLDQGETWVALQKLVREIPNHLPRINRIAIALQSEALPSTIQTITPTHLNRPVLDKLRTLDAKVTQGFAPYQGDISQLLAVLVPIASNPAPAETPVGRHWVAIRGVVTSDFMTARAALPGQTFPVETLLQVAQDLRTLPDIDGVVYDITGKPPATVEWE